jgi:Fungal specific transcription factor domain
MNAATAPITSSKSKVVAPRRRPELGTIVLGPLLSQLKTPEENFCFQFFYERTGPEFSGYYDNPLWSGYLLQACTRYPAIQHALVAVGAVHRRHELGTTPEAFDYSDFALRKYTQAIAALRKTLQLPDAKSFEIATLSSMLFSVFEIFQGNPDAAINHMASGFRILFGRPLQPLRSTQSQILSRFTHANLRTLINRLELMAERFFGSSAKINGRSLSVSEGSTLRFESLEEARDVIFTEAHLLLEHHRQLDGFCPEEQQDYVVYSFAWGRALAEYLKGLKRRTTRAEDQRCKLLRVYREAVYLLLLMQPVSEPSEPPSGGPEAGTCPPSVYGCSAMERAKLLHSYYVKIVSFCESMCNLADIDDFESHSFTIDSGIISPSWASKPPLQSTKARHHAAALLLGTPAGERLSVSLGSYTIADKLSAMEQGAMRLSGVLPENVYISSVDVTVFLEEEKMLLRYCIPQQEEENLIWTEQWLSFGTLLQDKNTTSIRSQMERAAVG